ncbi:MAG: FAD-binding protein [Alphaproteobacteria bacterium]|nr:FAD-binding protein [Alphaproteobacteria bacterium]
MSHLATDVLVVGAGGAGMYAAIAAARNGAEALLVDKSMISRGGATIMAQMTVAAAVGHQEPDHWTHHLADTIEAGRGLCHEELSAILCREAAERIHEMDRWKVGWARKGGRMTQVMAPGHKVPRCVYVDFLNTGPAVAKCLRTQVAQGSGITRVGGLSIIAVIVRDGQAVGAVGLDVETGEPVTIEAKAVVLAAGGLTKLYRRNSASINMGGDGYALALEAGAELIDMEFVQFFPIGHLAPRLVGMDPIMWDPFRYKLGGRLLNGDMQEFIHRYGASDSGKYTAMRDVTSYAIIKEGEAGRASPHGGAWLSFQHIPERELRAAFGPVIDRLLKNGIDLLKEPVEVAPIAHYHMGGVRVDAEMKTRIAGLYSGGEAVGGANGANRLSGNAITEAFVFGERAGRFAGLYAQNRRQAWDARAAAPVLDRMRAVAARETQGRKWTDSPTGRMLAELQTVMWDQVGLLRTGAKLEAGLARIRAMRAELDRLPFPAETPFNLALLDWHDLRASLLVAESVAVAAIARTESRGAHQREDHEEMDPAQTYNQTVELAGGALRLGKAPVVRYPFQLENAVAAE